MISLEVHLTDKCNLKCLHCYRDFSSSNNTFLENNLVKNAIDDHIILCNTIGCKSAIAFTGGEPLLHPDFNSLLDYAMKKVDEVFILTNGFFLSKEIISKLSKRGNISVQISVEGSEYKHDLIRGSGDFKRTCKVIDALIGRNIQIYCCMTVNQFNLPDILFFLEFCKERNLIPVIHRYIPTGKNEEKLKLSKSENLQLYNLISKYKNMFNIYPHCSTSSIVSLGNNYESFGCNIGTNCIVLDEKGFYIMCPYIKISFANVRDSEIYKVFFTSHLLNRFRERKFGRFCSSCKYNMFCGGCRAISLAYAGDVYGDEPLCPLVSV